jgi:hypothetical protein
MAYGFLVKCILHSLQELSTYIVLVIFCYYICAIISNSLFYSQQSESKNILEKEDTEKRPDIDAAALIEKSQEQEDNTGQEREQEIQYEEFSRA